MSDNWTMSAAARALHQVLALVDSARAPLPAVIDYGNSFEQLWEFREDLTARTVFLLWDETPSVARLGHIDTARHLNPLAWAVCAVKARKTAHVVIIDLHHGEHRSETRFYRLIEAIRPERLPWLRLVPLPDFGRFFSELYAAKEAIASASDGTPDGEALDMLAHQIRIELTTEEGKGDRHVIQNVVGPLILLGENYFAGKGIAERSLLRLFQTVGLISPDQVRREQLTEEDLVPVLGGQIRFSLVWNDQADCGWTDWVASMLPQCNADQATLEVVVYTEQLLPCLDAHLSAFGEDSNQRFSFDFPSYALEPTPSRQGS